MRATRTGRTARAMVATTVLAASGLLTGCGASDADRDANGRSVPSTTATAPSGPARLSDVACDEPERITAGPTRTLVDPAITEASGIGASKGPEGTLWLHNDSGDQPRIFSVTGEEVRSHDVPGAEAVDWEDMAVGPDGSLYVGDIGDNGLDRPSVVVYRFSPPEPGSGAAVTDVARLTLRYADRPHNAEALMIDPVDDRILVVAKGDGKAGIFSAPLAFEDGDEGVLVRVGALYTGAEGLPGMVTAADISPDGGMVLVRTYSGALLFPRRPGTSVATAMTGEGCPVPVGDESQGEAIAFAGDGYLTIGEGREPDVSTFVVAP